MPAFNGERMKTVLFEIGNVMLMLGDVMSKVYPK